jgi:transcriptional regulator GlxA family with amidase domain
MDQKSSTVEALIVAVPETAGSALYGMVDVLASAGNLWQQLAGTEPQQQSIRPRIVALSRKPFACGNRVPVTPDLDISDDPVADIVILPELWLAPDDDLKGRYTALLDWIRRRYRAGSAIYSACSGSVMLAATGLLDNKEATSHSIGVFRNSPAPATRKFAFDLKQRSSLPILPAASSQRAARRRGTTSLSTSSRAT